MTPKKHFDPAKHPRRGKGNKDGGQFAPKGGSASEATDDEKKTEKLEWSEGSEGGDYAVFKNDKIEIAIVRTEGETGDFSIGYGKPSDTAGVDTRYSPDEFTTMEAAKAYAEEHIDDFIAALYKPKKNKKRETGYKEATVYD